MKHLKVDPKIEKPLRSFKLPAIKDLVFGQVQAPVMVRAQYKKGQWGELEMLPYGPLSIDPCMKVLHYGQEVFEGMKAYAVDGKGPHLFRPELNYKRLNHSAKVVAMPEIPHDYFFEAVEAMVAACTHLIPNQSGSSLYLRPFMFASEVGLGIKPAEEFTFLLVASPAGAYFSTDHVHVLIEREYVRASQGGTGHAKTGGNYARGLVSAIRAKEKGFHQTLWLDAVERKYVEELSGMNFCAVVNGELHTPDLTGTILEGVTRDSLLHIAPSLGINVKVNKKMSIDQLIKDIKSGKCTEAFACGTASIIAPIEALGELSGERYTLKENYGPVTKKLRAHLLDIQEGRIVGPEGWIHPVNPHLIKLSKLSLA